MDAYYPHRSSAPPAAGSFVQWFLARLVAAALLLAFGYFAWRYVAVDRLDEEIRQRMEAKFRQHYQGLVVTVDAARRLEGQGVEIRGLTVREVESRDTPPLLYVERIFAECNTSLPEFVTREPKVSRIVMERAKVHAVRRLNGMWNVRYLFPPPKFNDDNPPIAFEDCTVDFVDETHPNVDPFQWRNVQLAVVPDPKAAAALHLTADEAPRAIRLSGSMTGDHFREVRLAGAADIASSRWSVQGEVEGLEFTPAMREGLPRDLAAELAPIAAVSGNTHLRFDVNNLAGAESPLQFALTGEISDGRIDDERLPLPLTEVSAKLRADNQGLHVDELKAQLGAAAISLSLRLDGYEGASPMVLRVATKHLALDDRLAQAMPPDILKLWRQLSPTGNVDASLTLAFDGHTWTPDIEADFTQLALVYEKFPYRLTDGKASLKLRNHLLTVHGNAWAGNSPVRFEAEVRDAGPNWSGWMEARSEEPMPIDDRLLNALTPAARSIAQSFNAKGYVQLLGRFDRRAGAKGPAHSHIEVQLCDCSLNYRSFPYPIDHVTGVLRGSDNVWSFTNLKGSQGTAQIQASGGYGPDGTRGPLLTMELKCTDVALDDTLRRALSVESQRLWSDVRPRGEVDVLGVNIAYRPHERQFELQVDGQKLHGAPESAANAIRVEPVWFPYAIDITSGTVRYRNGTLEISKIRGMHGKTKFEADGHCRWNGDGHWSLDLERVNADRLLLDHDLLAALPTDAGSALAKAKFSGALGMTGYVNLAGKAGDTSSLDANWDLSFDVEDGRLAGEVPVEHVHGELRVFGGVEQGRWFSRGEMKLDSFFVRGVQVTRVLGPFYIDSQQLLVGSWAERDAKGPPRRLTAQVFDGLVATDASVSLEDEGKFMLECTLEQADLAKITQEVGATAQEITGKTFGVLQMTGTTRGKHTWRGGGNIRLRDAYLYRIPLMVQMLKLLSIRSPDSTAFTTSDIDFRLQGDDVIFDRIDLTGDAISLRGRGRLYEQKQVDLMFYTQVGRRDIQALRPLLAEASPNFLLIEVTGTIDQPSIKKTAFPGLNETLREMFPEVARGDDGVEEAKAPRSSTPPAGFWRR
jgi:hypothetical protein